MHSPGLQPHPGPHSSETTSGVTEHSDLQEGAQVSVDVNQALTEEQNP